MIGLDTNVLVRYLAGDPAAEAQVTQAVTLIDSCIARQEKLFINTVVICEAVWVLLYHYDVPKIALVKSLAPLFDHPGFEFEDRLLLREALQHYGNHSLDFADCLIDQLNRAAGCKHTVSFDRQAIKKLGFIQP